jgi:hypothetical protein
MNMRDSFRTMIDAPPSLAGVRRSKGGSTPIGDRDRRQGWFGSHRSTTIASSTLRAVPKAEALTGLRADL